MKCPSKRTAITAKTQIQIITRNPVESIRLQVRHFEQDIYRRDFNFSSKRRIVEPTRWLDYNTNTIRIAQSSSNNKITSIPSNVKSLKALKNLNLSKNLIVIFPKSFSKIPVLHFLDLSYNPQLDFGSSFTILGEIKTLNSIDISNNELSSIPKEVMDVRYMALLNISNNQITELPDRMTQMIRLKSLDASNNLIENISGAFSLLEGLQQWNMNNNNLSSLPSDIGDMAELISMEANNNKLTSIPESLKRLTDLEKLDLGRNGIVKIGFDIGILKSLKHLNLGGNKLTDLDAKGIESLKHLEYLNLSDSPELKWELLTTPIFALSSLETLKIAHNGLKEIPAEITKCNQLKDVDFSGNEGIVTGEQFWKFMSQLPELTKLNLSEIALEVLSDNIKECKKLEYLNLDKNNIETISESIGDLKNLKSLSLNETLLKTIPESTSLLKNLETLSLINCSSIDISTLLNSIKNTKMTELNLSDGKIENFPEEIPLILAKQITLSGNIIKKSEIKRLKKELPDSEIIFE